ncbi:MAG: MBL fold metallo-hydrolase [Desulfobacteraceae bacterium]|nr:MBL fold metallo-hydrolase [Desulfobacteraceae bacterium]
MQVCKSYTFDHGIRGFKLGWSLAGPPLMTVYLYIFDHVMIDTGQSHMGNQALAIARENCVDQICLTHHHEDHSGNCARIHKNLGIKVFGHSLTKEKLKKPYKILPYQKYVWGKTTPVHVSCFPETMETGLGRIIPLHTPGHARDHVVYFLPEKGVVFSGDLYLGDRIRYFRADEDMGTQIASLKRVMELDFSILLCSHNPRQTRGRYHLQNKLDFLENLYGNIIRLWKTGMPQKEIFKNLKLKEDYFTKYFCFGNVSMINGVRSAIQHYEQDQNRA